MARFRCADREKSRGIPREREKEEEEEEKKRNRMRPLDFSSFSRASRGTVGPPASETVIG